MLYNTEQISPLPRILFLDHTAKMGGGEIALFNLLTHLDTSRFDAKVVLFSEGPLRDRLAAAEVPVTVLPLDPKIANVRKDSLGGRTILKLRSVLIAMRFTWRLSRLIRKEKADVVHTNSLKSDVLGGAAAWLAGVPVVWHIRDRITEDYLPSVVAKAFRIMCGVVPARLIANSSATLATLGRKLSERAAVVHSGYDYSNVNIIHDGTLIQPRVDPFNDGPFLTSRPVIGLVGRLTRWKGQHIFLQAAALVRKEFPAAQFQLIGSAMFGEDAYEAELRELQVALGLEHSVEFLGFRSDVSELIERLDILVHASITGEPFGQVIIEGMAAAKPVVATRGGGVPEIVVDGQTGILVPMGDAKAMAAAICEIMSNPDAAAEMGRAGFRRVMERFLVQHTAIGVMCVFDDLLRANRSRTSPVRAGQSSEAATDEIAASSMTENSVTSEHIAAR